MDYLTLAQAEQRLSAAGFTEMFDSGENGDCGGRLYYCRSGDIPRNPHGRPLETAQADQWGNGLWTVSLPGMLV